jgi:all-trans-retinol 13,14-reductase
MRTPKSCLILGSGMGGLALGALLARAGVEVTILEAHPEAIGGWAQTIHLNGYKFAAGPRYLCNFGPGQVGRRFLDKCSLAERVPMVEFDRRGFDHVYVGPDEPVRVPNGWSEYEEVLKGRFPREAEGVRRFFDLCRESFRVADIIDEHGLIVRPWRAAFWGCFRRRPAATAAFLLRRHLTLHQAFERCGLSGRLRSVLYGPGLVFGEPPATLSFHAYATGILMYHRGCYFPADDMEGFVGAVAETVRQHKGQILTNQRVVSVDANGRGVRGVKTQTGDAFTADAVVVNFDPRTFLSLIGPLGRTKPPRLPNYSYSRSVTSLFLGVADARVLEPAFGRWNVWYLEGADSGPGYCDDPGAPPPSLYVNSPTLVKGRDNDAPPGHATLSAFVPCRYGAFKEADPAAKQALKDRHAALILDVIETRLAPGLKQKAEVMYLDTPEDKERQMGAPRGNIYGRGFGARDVWAKVPFKGPLPDLYFVGSYVSFAGIPSVIQGACVLYRELTGDRV